VIRLGLMTPPRSAMDRADDVPEMFVAPARLFSCSAPAGLVAVPSYAELSGPAAAMSRHTAGRQCRRAEPGNCSASLLTPRVPFRTQQLYERYYSVTRCARRRALRDVSKTRRGAHPPDAQRAEARSNRSRVEAHVAHLRKKSTTETRRHRDESCHCRSERGSNLLRSAHWRELLRSLA